MCRRLRFLNPNKQTTTARDASGKSGRESSWRLAVFAVVATESVVVADPPAGTVMGLGLKEHVSPVGNPLQAKETVPAN
jgi:hypothetical protein